MSGFDLERFVEAQNGAYAQVCAELSAGKKRTHWMWFVFPQVKGLGSSAMAIRYGIAGLDEAKAYLAHEVLGPRLLECAGLVCGVEGREVEAIFGYPDDLKFHSSMTLFAKAAPEERVFGEALKKYFGGTMDEETLKRL
jgi:uncharacterized protein (DUF1810 family)